MRPILFFFFCISFLVSTASNDTLQPAKSIRFQYENDFFADADYYYTQGIRLQLGFPFIGRSPVSRLLVPLKNASANSYSFSFVHECFTPTSIRRDTVLTGDHPFAAFLYATHSLRSADKENRQTLFSEFSVGVMGPCAECKEMQEGIHRALHNIQPLGWQFQVSNDLVLNYGIRYSRTLFARDHLAVDGAALANAGTLYDNLGTELGLRLGRLKERDRKFSCYISCGSGARFIGYNASLQGGLFSKSIYTLPPEKIERLVLNAYGGVIFSIRRFSVEYSMFTLSREFTTGLPHSWGRCAFELTF